MRALTLVKLRDSSETAALDGEFTRKVRLLKLRLRRRPMSDDKSKTGQADRVRINLVKTTKSGTGRRNLA